MKYFFSKKLYSAEQKSKGGPGKTLEWIRQQERHHRKQSQTRKQKMYK